MTTDRDARQRSDPRFRGLAPLVATAAMVGVVLCAVGIFILANGVWREVDALAAANSDTTQWSLAQTEVEFLTLLVAVRSAEASAEPDLKGLRDRFDILYSRIDLLREGQQFKSLLADPRATESLAVIGHALDSHIPAIDGPDAGLIAALPRIEQDLTRLRPAARDFSLLGVRLFAQQSDIQRETLAQLLARIGYVTLALVLALLAAIGILLAMYRRSIRTERAAGDARNRLQKVISTSFDAIIAADISGKLIEYNGAAEQIFGYSRDEAIGGDMSDLIVPDHLKQAHAKGMRRYRETGERHVVGMGLVRLEARRKDGKVFPVEMSLSSAVYDRKEIFVAYLRDISDRVAAEQELIETRDRAVQGERAKAELLAVMSHEMRTPLNGIMGAIELLEGSKLSSAQGRYVSAMKTSAGLLLHHVNGVLSMSRAEAGQLDLVTAEVEPGALLHELVESQRPVIEANGNQICCDVSAAPARIWVDPQRLRQVILNLVGNANKFTRRGEIRVECDVLANSGQVEFRVIDNGIGIADEDTERIFEEFRTLDASYRRRAEGTGLGLAISRKLAQAMGGEIGVVSEPGEGSLFWLRLPLGTPQPGTGALPRGGDAAPKASRPTGGGLSILLVEDNNINRLVAREMLVKDGHSVLEAHDGLEGVNLAKLRRFDVILMDISMPDLDGVAATGIIRSTDGPNRNTPIIALTAHALQEDTNRILAAGVTDILIKPLSGPALRKAVIASAKPTPEPESDDEPTIASIHASLSAQMDRAQAASLYQRFIAEADAFVTRATAPTWEDEPTGLRADLAHKLAGSSAVLGAAALLETLRAMETAYRRNRAETARPHIATLPALWQTTRAEIVACLDAGEGARMDGAPPLH